MALSIINIHVDVSGTSDRFFNVLAAPLSITPASTLLATTFLDDTGVAATHSQWLRMGITIFM